MLRTRQELRVKVTAPARVLQIPELSVEVRDGPQRVRVPILVFYAGANPQHLQKVRNGTLAMQGGGCGV